MEQDTDDIWQHIVRLGIPHNEVHILKIVFESPDWISFNDIVAAYGKSRGITKQVFDSLLDRGWVEVKTAIKLGPVKLEWKYGLIDIELIISELEKDLERDCAYQKTLIVKSRDWLKQYSKENLKNKEPGKRVGRPPGKKNKRKPKRIFF